MNNLLTSKEQSIQRGDAVRAKLAELDLSEQSIADAVEWARKPSATKISRKK